MIFHDVVHRLHGTDAIKLAWALGRLDWKRSSGLWTGNLTPKINAAGQTELVMRGAGSSAKRQIVEVLRGRLGIDQLLQKARAA